MRRAQTVAHFSCCLTSAVRVECRMLSRGTDKNCCFSIKLCTETRATLQGHASAGYAITSTHQELVSPQVTTP